MNFRVFFKGAEQTVYPARVSAMQFNRVYQGEQRALDQTLISHFVSVELDSPGELCVESPEFAGKKTEIRPLDSGMSYSHDKDLVKVQLDHPCQFVIEAGDRHHVLHVFVNTPFHYEHTENEIYFGPGVHEAGTISPASGQTVCFDAGSVVYGHLKLKDVKDVKIVGPGILDSSGVPRDPGNSRTNPEFLTNSCFVAMNCENILVRDVIFRDAPLWAVITRNGCREITFDNIKIIGMWRYNSDGIDICTSRDIVIRNSFIRSFDDCFVARGAYLHEETEPVENVLVENCVMWCDWGKAMEVWGGPKPCLIRNVICRDIRVIHISHLVADVTTWFGSSDTKIQNITFEDISVDIGEELYFPQGESEETPVYEWKPGWHGELFCVNCAFLGIDLGNQAYAESRDLSIYNLEYENIVFRNISCHGTGEPFGLILDGSQPRLKLRNVTLSNLQNISLIFHGKIENLNLEGI